MLNLVELNAILYYADFLSLQETNTTVTDNCKYYYIYGTPMNCAYIVDSQPFYDEQNQYFQQAKQEYETISSKHGTEGVQSFLNNICNLSSLGCINAKQMLVCIHQYDGKFEKKYAIKQYEKWINKQIYTHLQANEKGELERVECTRYIAHSEIGTEAQPEVSYTKISPR